MNIEIDKFRFIRSWLLFFLTFQGIAAFPQTQNADAALNISVIELRNYLLKAGKREAFIQYFESNLINPQKELKGYPFGQYRVKGNDDNFFWIRCYENMKARSTFLPTFYSGPRWRQHAKTANSMMVNTDNTYLLQPLVLQKDSLAYASVKGAQLMSHDRIMVLDFYTANTRLKELLKLFARSYLPFLQQNGISEYTLWVSEPIENDFPGLPAFQDKNLLVMISFYKDESAYAEKLKQLHSKMDNRLRTDLLDVITFKNTLILYPTDYTRKQ